MQPDASMTRVEDDFWASQDRKSSLVNWKFSSPPHSEAYLSKAVHTGTESVTYVSHDEDDGAWQFLGDSMTDTGAVLVCLHPVSYTHLNIVALFLFIALRHSTRAASQTGPA